MRARLAQLSAAVREAAARRGAAPVGDLTRVLDMLDHDYAGSAAPATDDRFALVAQRFGLTAEPAALLLAAVGPSLDGTIAHAYDLLVGRPLHGQVTTALALELSGLSSAVAESARHLHPAGPLRRGGLLELSGDEGWLHRRLVVPDRVRAFLAGDDVADDVVLAVAVDAMPYAGHGADELARAIESGQRLVWVQSPSGAAGVPLAVAAFTTAGLDCLVVDARLAAPSALAETLLAAVREAGLRGMGLVVAGAEAVVAPSGSTLARIMTGSLVPVIAVGAVSWPAHRLAETPLTVLAPHVQGTDRAVLWTAALGSEPGPSITALRLTPDEILATTRYAERLAQARDQPVSDELLRSAARTLAAGSAAMPSVGQLGSSAPPRVSSFAELVLPPRVEAELTRLVSWVEHREEILARGTLHTKGGKGSGLAALFTGSPGTGKTLAAHVVADELGLELMQIDLSTIVDKFIGETEKNLERVFRDAESRNVVLFFDEADSLFGSRSAVQDAHDRYANQEVSYLLQRMEHFDGITLLATNLRGNLDPAFVRRIHFIVHFPDPDEETRRRLWHEHLAQAGETDPADPVDVDALAAAIELSGGDIRNIVLAAAYDAAAAGRPVGHRLVVEAATREHLKLGRRMPELR